MPAAVAIPLVSALAPAAASVGTGIYAAHRQSSSADNAAKLQTASADRALAFQREQAARDQQNFEQTQHANYDQWAAKESRLGTLGELVGLPSRQIPGYQSTSNGQPPPDLGSAQAKFNQLFPGATLTPEMLAAHRPELEAMGFRLNPNARGQITDLSYGGVNIDPIQGAGSGLNRKQWLVGSGTPAPRSSYQMPASTLTNGSYIAPTRYTAPIGSLPYQPLGRLSDLV